MLKINPAYFIILIGVLLFGVAAICAASYPMPMDDYVNDYAGVINKPDTENIRQMFDSLEHSSGIEAVVVTIHSINDYATGDKTIESFATNLFNTWGIGHQKENNGILILVAVDDREARIELGQGYGKQYDSIMKNIINEKMIPYFTAEDYSRGIYEGSRAVIESVTREVSWFSFYKWHILIGIVILVCIFAGISCMRSGKKGWGWTFFTIAGALIFFIIRALLKGKKTSGFGGGKSAGGGATGRW